MIVTVVIVTKLKVMMITNDPPVDKKRLAQSLAIPRPVANKSKYIHFKSG